MALARIQDKVFVHIDGDKDSAEKGLMDKIANPKFALYDMAAPTTHHNSSVRTRA